MEGLTEKLNLEIVNQRYPGDEEFVNRMRKRLGFLKEPGSRAAKASRKREHVIKESEAALAKRILFRVAKLFQISADNILQKKGFRGDVGKARSAALMLLHKHLPWSYSELASSLGLKNKSAIDYHLRKVKKRKDLQDILNKIDQKGECVI